MDSTLPVRICPAFKLYWVENGKVVTVKRYDHDRTYIVPQEIFAVVIRVFVNFNIEEHYIKFKDEDGDLVDLSLYDNVSFHFDKKFTHFYIYIFTSKEEAAKFVLSCPGAQKRSHEETTPAIFAQVEPGTEASNSTESSLNDATGENATGTTHPQKTTECMLESACKLVLTSATGSFHKNVFCNGCLGDVPSNRYKCLECPNFDLCARCEAKGLHPEHLMARVSQTFVHTHRTNLHDVLGDIYTKAAKRRK